MQDKTVISIVANSGDSGHAGVVLGHILVPAGTVVDYKTIHSYYSEYVDNKDWHDFERRELEFDEWLAKHKGFEAVKFDEVWIG